MSTAIPAHQDREQRRQRLCLRDRSRRNHEYHYRGERYHRQLVCRLVIESTDTKIVSNDITDGTFIGIVVFDSPDTKILSNDVSRNEADGIFLGGPKSQDAKVVGNDISGNAFGIYVGDAKQGSFAGNQVHDNCAGMFFESDGDEGPQATSR